MVKLSSLAQLAIDAASGLDHLGSPFRSLRAVLKEGSTVS